jgi:hypothetical protein
MSAIPKVNPVLMALAMKRVEFEKQADPGMPPGGGGMDPSMMGGGAPPPADPSMMGGASPAMAPAPAPAAPAAAPAAAAPGQAAAPPKLKAEDMIRAMDYRVYNLQMQLTAIMNALKINLPAGALVTPPGSFAAPQAELAAPGGPQDPTQGPAAAQGGGQSAIQPIEAMQGASPALAQGGGGGDSGGGTKQGAASLGQPAGVVAEPQNHTLKNNVAALASLLRSKRANGQ